MEKSLRRKKRTEWRSYWCFDKQAIRNEPSRVSFNGFQPSGNAAPIDENVIRNEPSRVSFNGFQPSGNAVSIGENVILGNIRPTIEPF